MGELASSSTALWFEDWEVGRVYETAPRTVTRLDVDHFAEVEGHKAALHLEEDYAKAHSVFGKLTVHGVMSVAIASGMMGDSGLFDGTALALLGLKWRFLLPVSVGDTITVRWWVSSKKASSRANRGVIVRSIELLNQDREVVCKGSMTSLWAYKPR